MYFSNAHLEVGGGEVRLVEPGEQDGGGPGGGGGVHPAGHPGPAHVPDELVVVVGGLGKMVMVEEKELQVSSSSPPSPPSASPS